MSSVHSERYRLFLARLKEARLAAGMTQKAAAKKLRVPQSYISKCESGERRVDVIELERFSDLYKKSLLDFLPKGSQ